MNRHRRHVEALASLRDRARLHTIRRRLAQAERDVAALRATLAPEGTR